MIVIQHNSGTQQSMSERSHVPRRPCFPNPIPHLGVGFDKSVDRANSALGSVVGWGCKKGSMSQRDVHTNSKRDHRIKFMRTNEPGGAYPGVSLLTLLETYAGGPCRKFKVKLNKKCKQFNGINQYQSTLKRLQVRLNQKMEISR